MGELGYLRFCRWGSSPCLAGCVVQLRRSGVALRASAALPGGWALVAAPWGYFDGAKIRFCLKENRFFGILHDEKAADCGGVLQACGRESRAAASLQPGGLRTRPDGGASLGHAGAPLPAVPPLTRTEPDHVRRRVGLGGEAARRGSGTVRCGGVSVGSERARERSQTPRGGCARRPAWRAKGYFRRLRGAGFGR